jgi:4'-phosphopantetheinyl transferase
MVASTSDPMKLDWPDAAAVRVRWLAVPAGDIDLQRRWRAMLDDDENARADRFRFAADRESFTAAHALARAMLSDATGLPVTAWRYVTGEFGKPALAGARAGGRLSFNISHTRGLVACAIAEDEVGVDVETADRRVDLNLARSVFAPEEERLLNSAPAAARASLFLRFWTLKEAFIKATGEGLARPLKSFSFLLDPARICFHPERSGARAMDDPAAWQFAEFQPEGAAFLAVAIERSTERPMRLDARAARPEEVGGNG